MSIESICEKYNITNYTINGDLVDVNGDVNLSKLNLTKLPLKFGSVSGSFDCYDNDLTTLFGSPKTVGGSFYCSYNQLTSLFGSPKTVGGNFYCSNNDLTTLEFSPESIGGDFYCYNNDLTTLEGSPESIGGGFYCVDNPIGSISYVMDSDFIRAFNTFKVIKDGVINLKRLKYVMEIFDKPIKIEKFKKHYKVI